MGALVEKPLLYTAPRKEFQWEFAERLQDGCVRFASGFARDIFFFLSDFPEAVGQLGGMWSRMINLVYGVCRSPSLQPFREELGHSKYIYRKGVFPEGGERLASHGGILLEPRDSSRGSLYLLQTNRRAVCALKR